MWVCKTCHSEVERNFHVCWNCGSDRKGNEDPYFRSQAVVDVERDWKPQTRVEKIYPFIFPVVLTTTIIALILSIMYGGTRLVAIVFGLCVAANLFAYLSGAIVTFLLRFPNDGGLRLKGQDSDEDRSR